MLKINKEKAKELILNSNGKIFSAVFRKKDGSIREMNARLGVEKYLKGGALKYNPADYNLVIVFDLQKKDYRSISCDNLMTLKMNGYQFDIDNE